MESPEILNRVVDATLGKLRKDEIAETRQEKKLYRVSKNARKKEIEIQKGKDDALLLIHKMQKKMS